MNAATPKNPLAKLFKVWDVFFVVVEKKYFSRVGVHEKVAAAMKSHIIPGGWVLKTGGASQTYIVCVLKKLAGISAAKKKHIMPYWVMFFQDFLCFLCGCPPNDNKIIMKTGGSPSTMCTLKNLKLAAGTRAYT